MRFKKHFRSEFEDTRLKRLAALRSQKRERERLPLFAELIGESQPDVDSLMVKRASDWQNSEQGRRDYRASKWREGRRRLVAYDDETRRAIMTYWNEDRWLPGDPNYFLGVLHSLDRGRLVLDGATLRPVSITISASQAVDVFEWAGGEKAPPAELF